MIFRLFLLMVVMSNSLVIGSAAANLKDALQKAGTPSTEIHTFMSTFHGPEHNQNVDEAQALADFMQGTNKGPAVSLATVMGAQTNDSTAAALTAQHNKAMPKPKKRNAACCRLSNVCRSVLKMWMCTSIMMAGPAHIVSQRANLDSDDEE